MVHTATLWLKVNLQKTSVFTFLQAELEEKNEIARGND